VALIQFLLSNCNFLSSQTNNPQNPEDAVQALWNYVNVTRDEKLYVHTDKEVYSSKDTVWLRGYLLNAVTNNLVDYSRYIYVELVDRLNVVHWREKIQRVTDDSLFVGYFPIPEVPQGEYFLRCYTYYMQNLDEEYIYRKRIRVINPYDHRVVCKTSIRDLGEDRGKLLILRFENQQGELYTNVEFNYRLSGVTPQDTVLTANSGYNGIFRLRIDKNVDYIWLRATQNSKLNFEKYIQLNDFPRNFHVQFFPEGGALLNNTKQKIAFKALGTDGLGIPISGFICNMNGDSICAFSSNKLGIGNFIIESKSGDILYAECKSEYGIKQRFKLPDAELSGMGLSLEFVNDEVTCNINKTADMRSQYNSSRLLIHSRGMPLAIFDVPDIDGNALDLSGAPEGIINFAIIDTSSRIISERLWFHRKLQRDDIDVTLLNAPLARGKAYCSILMKSVQDTGILKGTFSISVVNDKYSLTDIHSYGIESYLLLDSDLKGYIESPAYYFEDMSLERQNALDNLMLSQGWRKFVLDSVISGVANLHGSYYMERGQHLSGYVKNFWGRDSKNAQITLIGSNGVACEVRTDSVGRFIVNDIRYERGTTFVAQAVSNLGRKSLELLVDVPDFSRVVRIEPDGTLKDYDEFIHNYGKDYIFADNGERLKTLGIVTVTQTSDYQNLSYFKRLADEMEYEYYWRGKEDPQKYGHNIYTGRNRYEYDSTFYMHGVDPTKNREILFDAVLPKHLVQEQQMGRPRILGFRHVSPLESIDGGHGGYARLSDVTGIYLYGGDINTAGSIVPVYDKTLAPKREIIFNMQTFIPSAPQPYNVEFYVPKYNAVPTNLREIIDEKATRLWLPNVELNSSEPYLISFPVSGGEEYGSYSIIVEGITDTGTPIHKYFQFKNNFTGLQVEP